MYITSSGMVSSLRCPRMAFSLILLLLMSGLPRKSESASPNTDSTQPSAKECRVHIEKALDQYFDSSDQENQEPTQETQIQQPPLSNEDDDDDDYDNQISNDDDGGDDDDEDEEVNNENVTNETIKHVGIKDIRRETIKQGNNDDENDEDVDDDVDDDDDDDDDADDDDDDEYKVLTTAKQENNEGDNTATQKSVFARKPIVIKISQRRDQDSDGTQQNKTEFGDILRTANDDVDDDDDDDDDGDDNDNDDDQENDEEEVQARNVDISKPQIEKVTGGPDSASARVEPKLSTVLPQTEQPKTQTLPQEKEDVKKVPIPDPIIEKKSTPEKPKSEPVVIVDDVDDDEDNDEDEDEDDDDDTLENIYEDDDEIDDVSGTKFRSRVHIDAILGLDDIGTDYDVSDDKLAQSIFREIKRIHATGIRPMEMMYKFTESTTRLLGDAEIFSKPMILFLGPWSTGKSTIINYLLGTERTPSALKTGSGFAGVDFTVISYGEKRQTISGTELAADWKYASLQKFGQRFLDHFKGVTMPHTLLKKITLIDTPGILENRKNAERGYNFNDAFQWFVDRADALYVVLDPTKVDIGSELGAVIDQLKGRDVRFILNKADSIRRSELMRVVGQLFWNLSPLMSSTEAPVIYAVSLTTKPYNPSAPAKFLADQENNFLYDLKETMDKRVENRILYARRHAVRVRNHAKMVDCYLATYYRHKSIFSNKRNTAKLITENPLDYHIYEGLSSLSNVSRYDLPDASTYKNFFKQYPLYDFKTLASTCSYFRGCPMEKLDNAIAKELPELFTKYKKSKFETPQTTVKQDER